MGTLTHNTNSSGTGSEKLSLRQRHKKFVQFIKNNKKKFFWYWITYQAIKGTLTTSFIWAPLIYMWFTK